MGEDGGYFGDKMGYVLRGLLIFLFVRCFVFLTGIFLYHGHLMVRLGGRQRGRESMGGWTKGE